MDKIELRKKKNLSSQDLLQPRGTAPTSLCIVREEGIHCPICQLPTGRRMRGKIYCGNCGFIES